MAQSSEKTETFVFPLLEDPATYEPGTFEYEKGAAGLELVDWINVFRSSAHSFAKQAAADLYVDDAATKAEKFKVEFLDQLSLAENNPTEFKRKLNAARIDCPLLCTLRDDCLRKHGFEDIYFVVKTNETAQALKMYSDHIKEIETHERGSKDRWLLLLKGIFAGNLFDLGAVKSSTMFEKAEYNFLKTRSSLVSRPWVIDDVDEFISTVGGGDGGGDGGGEGGVLKSKYKKAVVFVDNGGADVVLGMLPFVRELVIHNIKVVIAANTLPSINDVTADDLLEILRPVTNVDDVIKNAIRNKNLLVVPSGGETCVMDLRKVSRELRDAAADADLVVFEGMGRAIETNLYVKCVCDTLNVGMVKHPEVSKMLNGRMYDCVCRFNKK